MNQSVRNRSHPRALRSPQTCPWPSPPLRVSNATPKPGTGGTCLRRGRVSFHGYWIEDTVKLSQTDKWEKCCVLREEPGIRAAPLPTLPFPGWAPRSSATSATGGQKRRKQPRPRVTFATQKEDGALHPLSVQEADCA